MPLQSGHNIVLADQRNRDCGVKGTPMKRRSQSEKRDSKQQVDGQDSLLKKNLKRSASSVDSGAGAEDEESESNSSSEEVELNNNKTKSKKDNSTNNQASILLLQLLNRNASGKRGRTQRTGDRKWRQQTASDSAVSTSVLSISGLSTPTESRIFSSPNLSDHSKTSFSPNHSTYPPLSTALKRKQERLKQELYFKEKSFQFERQRFIAETYRCHRISSGKRKENNSTRGIRSQRSCPNDRNNHSPETKMEPNLRHVSSKRDERKLRKEARSKSAGSEYKEKGHRERHTSMTTKLKDGTSNASSSSPGEGNKNKPLVTDTPSQSQSSIQTNSNSLHSEITTGGEKEVTDSKIEMKPSEKKQRHKSRKDRTRVSSRQRRHDSNEKGDNAVADEESFKLKDSKTSTDSDDVFDNAAKNLEKDPMPTLELEKRMVQVLDSIQRDGMPDIPTTEQITETGLLDWRAVFRVEMMRLRREVNEFRVFCQKQIELQAKTMDQSLAGEPVVSSSAMSVKGGVPKSGSHPPVVADQLRDLQANMKLFQKKQQLLDQETELLGHEERLAEKQKHLEEYEKEILEVESMLNHRQAICDRRQKTLLSLDEELQNLRTELEETREQMAVEGSIPESNSDRARKNWDMLKRNLMDEQKLLETTVQKYRSELASATSTIAGKDILISRLQSVSMQHEEELAGRDKRIKQLESKLSIALSETKSLMEQIPNSSVREFTPTPSKGDSDHASRRLSSEAIPENQRVNSFRSSNSYYRRPSSNATSEHGDSVFNGGGMDESMTRNSFRASRKRNSVSDNAISRLTLSTPRTEDKFGRTSSACVVQ